MVCSKIQMCWNGIASCYDVTTWKFQHPTGSGITEVKEIEMKFMSHYMCLRKHSEQFLCMQFTPGAESESCLHHCVSVFYCQLDNFLSNDMYLDQ